MKTTPKTRPTFYKVEYELNSLNWYVMTDCPAGFSKLPRELKLEETQKKDRINAPYVIHSHQKNNKYEFFTGLRPYEMAARRKFFYGNKPEFIKGVTRRRLLLFVLSADCQSLTVYYLFTLYNRTSEVIDLIGEFFSQI